MNKSKAVVNWSGGKDSALALYKVLFDKEVEVTTLLTSISQSHQRISMHGVRVELLRNQTKCIGLPLQEMQLPESPDMDTYNRKMEETLTELKPKGIDTSIYGDIFLEDLKAYREKELEKVGLHASFPLWKISTSQLIQEFLELGFKTIVVCVNEKYLDKSFVGRVIDESFIKDLPVNVDPCGENGEFHTFVFDGPIFKQPVPFTIGEIVHRQYTTSSIDSGFWFCDLLPIDFGEGI